MKLARLIDIKFQSALVKLSKQDVPLSVAFKLKGINKVVNEELNKYEEVRKEALHKHGKKKEDGSLDLDDNNNVKFEGNSLITFASEINELVSVEVNMASIKIADLGNNITMSMEDLLALEGLIED